MLNKLKRHKSFNVKPTSTKMDDLRPKKSPIFNRRVTVNPSTIEPGSFLSVPPDPLQKKLLIDSVRSNALFRKQAKSNLERRKSVSLDSFRYEKMELQTVPKVSPNLNNRKSVSLGNFQRGFENVVDEIRKKQRVKKQEENAKTEFTSALENYQDRTTVRTPRFPVDARDEEFDVELRRSHDKQRSPRSQTLHIMPEDVEPSSCGGIKSNVIEIRSPKWTYDGQLRERVPLMRFHDGELSAIKDNAAPEIIACDLQISKKSPKKIELTDADKKVYIIKSDSIKQNTIRERANSLTEKPVEKKKNILQKLLKRRSNRDLLERKGILMNEEIFGNTLIKLYEKSRNVVPTFVKNTIALIEIDKNIKSEHIYRIPGNLATIQKIRVNVDRNNIKILDEFKNDPDVLTGSLKLFFRELKEPLIPHRSFEQLQKLLDKPDEPGRNKLVKNVIEKMECPHRETFETLIEHLLKVEAHTEDNKMNINSLSIVWGPSLLWPADYTKDNVVDFSLIVNKVIEMILTSYKTTSKQSDFTHMRNEFSQRRKSLDKELNSIYEEQEETTSEESVKSSPKVRLKNQIMGFMRSESKDNKIFGSNLSLASSYENETTPPRKDSCGYKLEAMVKKENTNVPELIYKIIPQIEKHASMEGIYTQAGDKEKVSKLKKKMKPDVQKTDIHDVISLLKIIIQELEEPLIPASIFNEFIDNYSRLHDVQKQQLVSAGLAKLKPSHRETVEYLVNHLLKILSHKDKNKLSEETISIIWAPIFYPPLKLDKSNKDDLEKYLDFVVVLLRIYDKKRKIEVSIDEGKNFRHNIKFATVAKNSTQKTAVDGPTLRGYKKYDGEDINDAPGNSKITMEMINEKFKDIDQKKRHSDELVPKVTVDDAANKITLGTVTDKLKDIVKYDHISKRKIATRKPASFYDNVAPEVYRETNKFDS